MTTPATGRAAGVGVRLPRGVVHTDARCHHIRGKAVTTPLLAPTAGEVCKDCCKRTERQRDADRAAHTAAVVAQVKAEIASLPVDEVARRVSELSRTGRLPTDEDERRVSV